MDSQYGDSFTEIYDLLFPVKQSEILVLNYILDNYCRKKTPEILDVGCGNGRMYLWAKKRGVNYIGCDISSSMLQDFKNKHNPPHIFQHNIEEKINCEQNFDICLVWGMTLSMFSLSNQIKVLKNIIGVLNKDGIVIAQFARKELIGRTGIPTGILTSLYKDDICEIDVISTLSDGWLKFLYQVRRQQNSYNLEDKIRVSEFNYYRNNLNSDLKIESLYDNGIIDKLRLIQK